MDTNTVQVVTAFGNKLDAYINVLAEKVGVAADHFWPVLVQQQVIDGWGGIGLLVICILGLIFTFTLLMKSIPPNENDFTPKRFVGTLVGVIGSIILIINLCVNTSDLPNNIAKINNPEYYAMQTLVKMVK